MPTFVLVHGGGYTSACWDRVVPLLDGDVVAVDLPGRGRRPDDVSAVRLAANVAATVDDIEASGAEQVVLVGHSMAGLTVAHVLNEAAHRVGEVVLVSCTVPPHGSSVVGNIDPEVRASVLAGSGGGVFRLDEATARDILCNDMDEEQSAFALAGMVDEATAVLDEPVDLTGLWGETPVTYVRLSADKTLPPDQQAASIAAIRAGGKHVTEVEIDAGHMVMISRPAELAAVLNAVAAGSTLGA
jgi:pimeloyl-ACP methyl ester carboxylesterase